MTTIATSFAPDSVPPHVSCRRFLTAGIDGPITVLDVGCGYGELMGELTGGGCTVLGVEIDADLVRHCQEAQLRVTQGSAEEIPFPEASFDAVVCSVVLPYTDERRAVAEWARVLKPGGVVNVTGHGLGYGLEMVLRGRGWKRRLYGLRMLANTAVYQTTGRRLPGPLGDTICQTSARLRSYYALHGLILQEEQIVRKFAGLPVFLCHRAVKQA